jgi:hypothetical protein
MDFQARWREAVEPILVHLQYMGIYLGPVGQAEILHYDSLFPVFRLLHGDDRLGTFVRLTNRYDVAIQIAPKTMTTDSPQIEVYTSEGQQMIAEAIRNLEDFLHNPDKDIDAAD